MSIGKYARLTLVYFIGLVIIIVGLYYFLTGTDPQITSNSFYAMFSGLVVATAGSIYGHNKVAGPGSIKGISEKKEKIKQEMASMPGKANKEERSKRLEELKKLEADERKKLKELKEEEEKELKRIEEEEKKLREKQKAEAMKEAEKLARQAKESKSAKTESAPASAPAGGVIKIMVCPSCGEENKYTAKFCDNCGKKLRP